MGFDEEALMTAAASEEGTVSGAGDNEWLPSVGSRYPIHGNRLCNIWKIIDPSNRMSLAAWFRLHRERNSRVWNCGDVELDEMRHDAYGGLAQDLEGGTEQRVGAAATTFLTGTRPKHHAHSCHCHGIPN
jgi:hypothetical protein